MSIKKVSGEREKDNKRNKKKVIKKCKCGISYEGKRDNSLICDCGKIVKF